MYVRGVVKQKVTLSIDRNVYKRYKKFCEENAIALSKRIELFMKQEMEQKRDEIDQKTDQKNSRKTSQTRKPEV